MCGGVLDGGEEESGVRLLCATKDEASGLERSARTQQSTMREQLRCGRAVTANCAGAAVMPVVEQREEKKRMAAARHFEEGARRPWLQAAARALPPK